MNVLYIDHYAGGLRYGMEYRPFYLAREWARAGHRVTIAAASHSHVRMRQPTMDGRFTVEQIDGVRHVWCRTPAYRGNGIGRVVNILVFLRRLAQSRRWLDMRPDVVIASSTYPMDIRPSRSIARRHGALLVWEVHDLWPLSPIELGGMSPRHPFIRWVQRHEDLACREASLVVSMLPLADRHLVTRGMASGKFVHIPNGIDADEWHEDAGATLPASHLKAIEEARTAGRAVVGYAGAHGIANALDSMLDAAAIASEAPVTWLLVGSGPEKARLERRVASEQLHHVRLLDPVPKAAMPALLRAMDVLCIGLQREPLFRFGISPNKLMDYMMAGRPIVSAIEAGNDPVREARCGTTVAAEDPPALARAVLAILALDPEARAAMGRNGRRFVESHHLYGVLARRFMDAVAERIAHR